MRWPWSKVQREAPDRARCRSEERRDGIAGTYAKEKGVKYFLISFVDLFGTMRAKIVPATAIDMIAKSGAGFAGFATWLDMTPADPDMLVMPDPETADPAALEARGGVGDGRSRAWTASW